MSNVFMRNGTYPLMFIGWVYNNVLYPFLIKGDTTVSVVRAILALPDRLLFWYLFVLYFRRWCSFKLHFISVEIWLHLVRSTCSHSVIFPWKHLQYFIPLQTQISLDNLVQRIQKVVSAKLNFHICIGSQLLTGSCLKPVELQPVFVF